MFTLSSKDIFLTGDSHLGHANIIKYCNRPYNSVHLMNKGITEDWNKVVSKNSWVIHLGDFSFNTAHYIDKLNGRIILVRGNHDNRKYDRLFEAVVDSLPVQIGEFNCYFTHIPIDPNEKYKKDMEPDFTILDRYDFIICGHVHKAWVVKDKNINVGMDIWGKPIYVNDIVRFMRRVKEENITNMKSL